MDSKVFYRLNKRRQKLENELETFEKDIKVLREGMKKLKKGSNEREEKNEAINKIMQNEKYKELKACIKTMNFCINVACYY